MANNSGFTNKTAERFIIDAGAVYLNSQFTGEVFTAGTLLGATAGGNEFVLQQEMRQIEVDGVKGRGKGLQVISFQNPVLTVNLKEMTAKNLSVAIAGSDLNVSGTKYDVLTSKGVIRTEDYIENVTLVGTLTGSKDPVIIVVYNVLNIEGLEMTFEKDNEVVIPVAFGGHYDETGNVPFKIYFPKTTA